MQGTPDATSVPAREAEVAIAIESVSHSFAHQEGTVRDVLSDVSLNVRSGEFLALVGPSGCGKTTLLNMIAGFIGPNRGSIRLFGDLVDGLQPQRTAYMFARDNLLPWRRTLSNVMLALEMGRHRRLTGAERQRRARELLETVGLGDFEHYYPRQLSQGMRQRVALARTLAVDSEIWLMDEPFGALDAHTKTLMQVLFAQISDSAHKTVVFVTHDLSEAIALADRVAVMAATPGRIKGIYNIALPRPRSVIDLHSDRAFLDLYRRLWGELRPEL